MGLTVLSLATAGGIWTKFGLEVAHTPRKVTGYVTMWWAWHGHGSIDLGNCWRDLDQIWHEIKANKTIRSGQTTGREHGMSDLCSMSLRDGGGWREL